MHGCTTTTAVPFPFRFPRNRGVMEKASCNVEMRRGREKQQKKHPVEQPLVWGISSPEVSYRVAIVFRFGFVCPIPCLRYRINKSKQWLGAAKKHKREPSNSFQSSAMLKNIHDRWWSSLRHSLITKSKLHENVNCVCKELCFTLVVLPPFGRLFFFSNVQHFQLPWQTVVLFSSLQPPLLEQTLQIELICCEVCHDTSAR